MPPDAVHDISWTSYVLWSFGSHLGADSDHVPVVLSITPIGCGDPRRTFPRWLGSSQAFQKALDQALSTIRVPPRSPAANVSRFKQLISTAAASALASAHLSPARTLKDNIYWCIVLLRSSRGFASRPIEHAIQAFPALRPYVRGECIDFIGIESLLRTIATQMESEDSEPEDMDVPSSDPPRAPWAIGLPFGPLSEGPIGHCASSVLMAPLPVMPKVLMLHSLTTGLKCLATSRCPYRLHTMS